MIGNDEYRKFVQRIHKAYARRIQDGDVEALAEMVDAHRELGELVREAGTFLHDQHGYSYTEIAKRLGGTRQAARQRFTR